MIKDDGNRTGTEYRPFPTRLALAAVVALIVIVANLIYTSLREYRETYGKCQAQCAPYKPDMQGLTCFCEVGAKRP